MIQDKVALDADVTFERDVLVVFLRKVGDLKLYEESKSLRRRFWVARRSFPGVTEGAPLPPPRSSFLRSCSSFQSC